MSHGFTIMIWEVVSESLVDTFVNQNTHLRTSEQEVFRFFKGSDG